MAEGMADEDFEKREELLKKLSNEEAALVRKLSAGRQMEIYGGFADKFVHLRTDFGKQSFTFSCQEVAL
jgi:hypothetical protein